MAFILANSQLSLGANEFVPVSFSKTNNDDEGSGEEEDGESGDESEQTPRN